MTYKCLGLERSAAGRREAMREQPQDDSIPLPQTMMESNPVFWPVFDQESKGRLGSFLQAFQTHGQEECKREWGKK